MSEWEETPEGDDPAAPAPPPEDPAAADNKQAISDAIVKSLQDQGVVISQNAAEMEKYLEKLKEQQAIVDKMVGSGEVVQMQVEAARDVEKQRLKLMIQQAAELGEITPKMQAQIDEQRIIADEAQRNLDIIEKHVQFQTQKIANARAFGQELAGAVAPWQKNKYFNISFAKNFWSTMTSGAQGFGKALLSFGTGIFESLIGGMIDMAFELDNLRSNLMKTGFINRERAYELANESRELSHLFVSSKEYEQAVIGLGSTVTDFTRMTKGQQKELTRTAALYQRFGISADDVGKALQNSIKIMGQTSSQANKTSRSILNLSESLGVPVKQLMGDFNKLMPELAKLGPTAAKSFKEMARVAKITGMEIQKLLNMTNKFDTFEGAAEQVGKMNAALGGNFLNAMDMMTETDPVGRFEMMRGALEEAGLEFDSMSYYQRKFFAESMGLESVGELAKMMSGDMGDMQGEMGKTAADYKKMEEKAAEAASIQEKFKAMLSDVMKTLVDSGMLEKIDSMFNEFAKKKGPMWELKETLVSIGETIRDHIIPFIEHMVKHWKKYAIAIGVFKGLQLGVYIYSIASSLGTFIKMIKASTMWTGFKSAATSYNTVVTDINTGASFRQRAGIAKDIIVDKAKAFWTGAKTFATGANTTAENINFGARVRSIGINAVELAGKGLLTVATWGLAAATWALGLAMNWTLWIVIAVAVAIYFLVDAFLISSPSLLVLAVIGLAIAFYFLAPAITAMIPVLAAAALPLMGVGLAVLMIGAAVYLAATGMGMFVASLAGVDPGQILAAGFALMSLGAAFYMVAGGLALLANPLSQMGIMTFAMLMGVLTMALTVAGTVLITIIDSLTELFATLGELSIDAGVGEEFENIADGLADIAITDVTPGSIGIVGEVTDMFAEAAAFAKEYSGGGGGRGGGGSMDVKIQLDGDATKDFLEGLVADAVAEAMD